MQSRGTHAAKLSSGRRAVHDELMDPVATELADCAEAVDAMIFAFERLCQRIREINDEELAVRMTQYCALHTRAVELTHPSDSPALSLQSP